MNKKLVLATALVFGVCGLMLAHNVKAQDAGTATDNSAAAGDNGAMAGDNAAANAAQ